VKNFTNFEAKRKTFIPEPKTSFFPASLAAFGGAVWAHKGDCGLGFVARALVCAVVFWCDGRNGNGLVMLDSTVAEAMHG
jgi:hypothetical protein